MDLRATVFSRIDLEAAAAGLARRGSVSGDVVFVQALESRVVLVDSQWVGACGVESAGGTDATEALAVSTEVGGDKRGGRAIERNHFGWRVVTSQGCD